MPTPLERILELMKLQRYSEQMQDIVRSCDIQFGKGIITVTASNDVARHHGHLLVCNLAIETGFPVELRIR